MILNKFVLLVLVLLYLMCLLNCNDSGANTRTNDNVRPNSTANTKTEIPGNFNMNGNFNIKRPRIEEELSKREQMSKEIHEKFQKLPTANNGFNPNRPDFVPGNKCMTLPVTKTWNFGGQSPITKVEKVIDCGVEKSAKVHLRNGKTYEVPKSKIHNLEKATEQEILKMIGINSVVKTNSNTE